MAGRPDVAERISAIPPLPAWVERSSHTRSRAETWMRADVGEPTEHTASRDRRCRETAVDRQSSDDGLLITGPESEASSQKSGGGGKQTGALTSPPDRAQPGNKELDRPTPHR